MSFTHSVRRRFTAEQKAEMLAAYQGGHLTQKDFAAKIGVVPATLAAWVRRAAVAKAASSDAFVSVPNLFPPPASGPAYRIVFPRLVTVAVPDSVPVHFSFIFGFLLSIRDCQVPLRIGAHKNILRSGF